MLGNRPNCMRSMRVSLKEGCAQFLQLYFLACYHGFGWNSCEVISCLQRSTLLGFEMQLQRISSWLWLCHCLDDSVVHANPGLDENSEVTPWLGLEHPPVIVLGVNSYSYLVWIWGICFQCLYLKECCPAWIRSSLSSLAVGVISNLLSWLEILFGGNALDRNRWCLCVVLDVKFSC